MAVSSADRYVGLMKRLLPRGLAWTRQPGTFLEKLFQGLSVEFARIHARALSVIEEADPQTAIESLSDHERIVGIPDDCQGVQSEIGARRDDILRKYRSRGGQNAEFYRELASSFGYTATVERLVRFRAGHGHAGDEVWGDLAVSAFRVKAPAVVPIPFRAGQSSAGDALQKFRNDILECVILRGAPAHANVIFSYGG